MTSPYILAASERAALPIHVKVLSDGSFWIRWKPKAGKWASIADDRATVRGARNLYRRLCESLSTPTDRLPSVGLAAGGI